MTISHLVANDPEIPVFRTSFKKYRYYFKLAVLASGHVCRENRSRTDTYVSEIYSQQKYRRTYQANFHPVLSENFWRDVPFNLTFYLSNMKKERGRKQGKRF
ncbi:hypothetical protein M9H77_21177 [Catharanthus roseus]|uniref:Uncharacterized protein n=1 Tax=Catharanthus roseus TaxID=4058 RepID=A0ACC0AM01_CATRO|nr:hypothetical protein M9H77_21177 [Catharanthus roseus]